MLLVALCLMASPLSGLGTEGKNVPEPAWIVEQADHIRFPQSGFQVDVTITTRAPEREEDVRKYRVISKGHDRTLIMTLAPAVDRGQILLMRDLELWVFMPAVSQPVRLPLSQRLTGQVANGDLARANFAGDYDAELLRTETIDGKSYYVLELVAARRGVTYNRVVYWVEEGTYRPYKAEFYSISGRLLKSARYERFAELGGGMRPTRMVVKDAVREGQYSVLDYAAMQARELPDKVFTKQYLKKLR